MAAGDSGGAPGARPRLWWWLATAAAFASLMALPSFLNIAQQFNISIVFILALLALSMSFLWGYVGILSFGQTAFFGLGAVLVTVNTALKRNAGNSSWSMPPVSSSVYGRV